MFSCSGESGAGDTVPLSALCNGTNDCGAGQDEAATICDSKSNSLWIID